jgi:predicted permease
VDGTKAQSDVTAVFVLNILAPVFLLIAIGAGLQRSGFVSAGFLKEANRVTYWLGLPALLFSQLATSVHDAGEAKILLSAVGAATLAVVVLAYVVAWILRVSGGATGTFVQASFRGNVAFIGLPIVYAMPETVLSSGISVRAAAVVLLGPMMVAYNLVGVVVLLLSQHSFGWKMISPFARQLLTTPPLVATVAGLGFAMMGWTLPPAIEKALVALGEMALPLGLLGVGGALVSVGHGLGGRAVWGAAVMKTVFSPLLGWVVGRAFGLGPVELKMLLIFMATPTAVASYTVALELKGDEALASGSIVLSVLTSVAALAAIIAFF